MAPRRLDRPHRIGEDAAIVIGLGREDAAGHEARMRRIGADRIGRITLRPAAALPARVHDEHGIAGCRPQQMLVREAAAAAIADKFDDAGKLARALARQDEPGLDRMAAETGKGHVEHLDDLQPRVERLEARIERHGAGLGQRSRPEGVEVTRTGNLAAIGAKLRDAEIIKRHGLSPESCGSSVAAATALARRGHAPVGVAGE